MPVPAARPFLKWAGGKGALVQAILARAPALDSVERYIEPFLGAGAMLFGVLARRRDLPCLVSDANPELIATYVAVRDELDSVIALLAEHASAHGEAHYYAVRADAPAGSAERAARFIYLNRTCFNGLYRVNRKGQFNVPMGRYARPRILDRDNLRAVSHALRNVDIRAADYSELLDAAGRGDLVYLDPPYQPLSPTSSFTSYTRGGFDGADQKRLAARFGEASRRGATVILSNSSDTLVRGLYASLSPRPTIDELDVPRAINAKSTGRGPVRELLVHYGAAAGASAAP